jgi:dicarboxylate transporter 10
MAGHMVKTNGFFSLYNGLSAAILRQATYSTTRFAAYDIGKKLLTVSNKEMPFYQKILLAGASGGIGGIVGTPADLVNVRMQNDVKLSVEQRRNYKHCFEALVRIYRTEGYMRLHTGTVMASSRGMLMTVGQLAFYDEIKFQLIKSGKFSDNIGTHFAASLSAAGIATCITMPLDVVKTRMMNARVGEYSGIVDCGRDILRNGPSGFFKGFTPAFVRLGPHTVLTFVFLEQLKKLFMTLSS